MGASLAIDLNDLAVLVGLATAVAEVLAVFICLAVLSRRRPADRLTRDRHFGGV
jgi:hypothetical protein